MKNEDNESTTKKIIYSTVQTSKNKEKEKEEKREKEKRKRIITQTNKWNHYFQNKETDLNNENQWFLLQRLREKEKEEEKGEEGEKEKEEDKKIYFLREQIRQKLYNYYSQDMKKQLYNPENFITLEYILQKLQDCHLECYYCRESVFIWYEIAREPKQWTVERIDNKIGHDIDNIEIACLSCNLKRRCMYHERYVFTKQMKIVKI
jgi:hypothetical protein